MLSLYAKFDDTGPVHAAKGLRSPTTLATTITVAEANLQVHENYYCVSSSPAVLAVGH
jgi:hypothetical protein